MTTEGTHAIVNFVADNTIEVVRVNWIVDNMCWWPPKDLFTPERFKKAVKRTESVGLNWVKLDVKVIKVFGKSLFNIHFYFYCNKCNFLSREIF